MTREEDSDVERLPMVGELEVNEDPRWERAERAVRRVGWLLLAVFVILSGFGLFGDGPLAETRRVGDGWSVSYNRFIRIQSPSVLAVSVPVGESGVARLRVASSKGRDLRITGVRPEPDAQNPAPGGVEYVFTRPQRRIVSVFVETDVSTPGEMLVRLRTDRGALTIRQIVFP